MSLPTIGFGPNAGVKIDLPALLERRLLVQAASGGGKSTLLRALIEQCSGKVQQWVIDREGDFVTLREAGDFVLVGRGGDVPADRKTVKLLARRLMELGASAVFDLSELRMHEQREYVKLLFEELTHMPRSLWHPLMVWLDEGHFFAPQAEKCVSTQAVADGASVWRKRGYCLAVATQRLSKLDKDVAAELHNKFIGFTDDVDLKRAGDQLGMTTEQRAELQQLDPGVFYAYGPAISRTRVKVIGPKPKTSPPPKGEARSVTPPAPEKVREILGKLADLAKESEEEARTADDLRRAVAERDREIRQLKKGGVVQTVEKPIVDQAAIDTAYHRGRASAMAAIGKQQRTTAKTMRAIVEQLERASSIIGGEIASGLKLMLSQFERPMPLSSGGHDAILAAPPTSFVAKRETKTPAVPTLRESDPTTVGRFAGEQLPKGAQRIIDAIAAMYALGIETPSKAQVATFAGYTAGAGYFANNLGALRSGGYIEYPAQGVVSLTAEGHRAANPTTAPSSLAELHERWFAKLPNAQSRILRVVVEARPESLPKAEVAERAGMKDGAGYFANNIGAVRSIGLIEYGADRTVFATSLLFPEGLS